MSARHRAYPLGAAVQTCLKVTPAGAAEAVVAANAVPPHVKNIKAKKVRNEQTVVVKYFFKKLPLCGICGQKRYPQCIPTRTRYKSAQTAADRYTSQEVKSTIYERCSTER